MTTPSQINPPRNNQRQRGAAILILVLILMLGLITLFTFRMDRRGPELEADRKTALALAQAKEALLGRAASHTSGGAPRPGILPCPDTHARGSFNEGVADSSCNTNALGRLPWRTLDLPDLGDGAYGRLWYKLSINFQGNSSIKVNTATLGTLTVGGAGPMFAAIVFAPGAPLDGQVRDNANYNNFLAYLEGYTNVADTNFNNSPGQPINDRLITILPIEIKNVVVPMVAEDIRVALDSYFLSSSAYPASSSVLSINPWVHNNQWLLPVALVGYQKLSDTTAQLDFSPGGCPTIYQYSWNAGLGRTVMNRNGKC